MHGRRASFVHTLCRGHRVVVVVDESRPSSSHIYYCTNKVKRNRNWPSWRNIFSILQTPIVVAAAVQRKYKFWSGQLENGCRIQSQHVHRTPYGSHKFASQRSTIFTYSIYNLVIQNRKHLNEMSVWWTYASGKGSKQNAAHTKWTTRSWFADLFLHSIDNSAHSTYNLYVRILWSDELKFCIYSRGDSTLLPYNITDFYFSTVVSRCALNQWIHV